MKKKLIKKLAAIVMAISMLASIAAVAANAASAATVRQYKKYAFIGDSIAAGFSLEEYNAHGQYVWPWQNINGSYPNLVSKAVQATSNYGGKTYPLAAPGFRTQEVRMMLDDDYAGDDITKNYVGELASASGDVYDYQNLLKKRSTYQNAVKNADLITLDIGLNDTWLPVSAISLFWRDTGTGATDVTEAISYALKQYGTIGNVMNEGLNAIMHLVTWPAFLSYMVEVGYDLMQGYYTNYPAIVEKIYELNPDVTLVLVGSYNSFSDWEDAKLLGPLLDTLSYNKMNQTKKNLAAKYDNCYYVDMTGVDLITKSFKECIDNSSGSLTITYNPHPTAAGHQDMATRIIKELPTGKRAVASKGPNGYPWLTKVNGVWAYRKSGNVQTSYTGLGESDYGIYYVKNGTVKFDVTGIVTVSGKKYYVKKNRVITEYTGIIKAGKTTYYVKEGIVKTDYSGMVTTGGKTYYVIKGVVQTSYTGIVAGTSKSYYVRNGVVDTSYSGTVTTKTKVYTVKNGIVVSQRSR